MRREKVRNKCAQILRRFHLYGTPALVGGLLLYVGWQFDWLNGVLDRFAQLALILIAVFFVGLAVAD
jgi:hypothetical protein